MSIFPVNTYRVRSLAKPSEILAGLSKHVQPFPYVRVLPGRIQEHKTFWGRISETGFCLVRISNARNSFRRSRAWVQRWIDRYRPDEPRESLQDHSRAPKQMSWTYPERTEKMVLQMRVERVKGKQTNYQYALVSAPAIYYELCELHVSPLPSSRTIHRWLKQAGQIRKRKSQKPPNPTYPLLPCKAVNDVQELDFKGPFYLKDRSHKYYRVALRDKLSKKTALRALANKSMDAILDFLVAAWQWAVRNA